MKSEQAAATGETKLRIGLLTNYHMECTGGAEEAYDQLASHWHAHGHQITLFSTPPRSDRPFHRRPWQPAYDVVSMPRPFSTRFGLRRFVSALEHHHARRPFDLLFAGDTYWAGFVAHWFSQRTGVPFVINCQGVGLIEGCRFAKRWLTRRRIAAAISAADGFVAPSRYIQDRARSLTTPRGIDRVIPNGWPDSWLEQSVVRPAVDGRYVFGMGRLIPLKGFHTLIEATALLRAKHPDVGLIVAGDGSALPELVELAEARGWHTARGAEMPTTLGSTAWFPGFVHGDVKRALIAGAEVAVSPSIRKEPMSLALFEILSCGIPVVGSAVGGTPDIVVPGVNGELFKAEDVGDLAAKLDRILGDGAYRRRLADESLPSVKQHRWSEISRRFEELFRDVLAARFRTSAA